MRARSRDSEALELRAHTLLADVPLHDVWVAELPGGGAGRTLPDVRALLEADAISDVNPLVRFLFGLRSRLGRLLGWDASPLRGPAAGSFIERLSASERDHSLVEPGTREGPFTVLSVTPREAISEAINATVHAFSVFALVERSDGYLFYWAIYVRPVGWFTPWYMHLIDPFRRFIVYPAVLRHLRARWETLYSDIPGS
jgi:hypothetical protein